MKTRKMLPQGHLKSSIDADMVTEDRTVEVTFSTGAKGLRRGWDGDFYEELSMEAGHVDMSRLQAGAPLLASHDSQNLNAVIGVVEKAWLEGNAGKAVVRFSSDPEAEKIYQKVKERVLRNVSIGYQVRKYEDVSKKGDSIPTYRAVDYSIHEISIVPIGFDAAAQIRNQSSETHTEVEIINEGITMSTKTTTEIKAEEKQRMNEIRTAVRSAKLEETYADELCNQDITADQARKMVFEKMATAPQVSNTVSVEVGNGSQQKMQDGLTDAIATRLDKTFKSSSDTRAFDGKSLVRNIEQYLGRQLGETDAGLAKRAMSSSDFPLILANAANKAAQNRYILAPKSFSQWTSSETLRDYKEASRLRAGDFPELLERPEGGEILHGSFGEEKEVVQLKDYSRMVAFTSQSVVNDDLKLLAQVANEGGLSAARKENKLCYDALKSTTQIMADGAVLYHASHGNLGTAGVISETTVAEAYKLMRKQRSVDGSDPLSTVPRFLITGPDIEIAAMKFLATVNASQTSNVNVFSGKMELIVDAQITGNQYFFAADPSQIPTVTIFRLEGQEMPSILSRVHFETSSLQLKVEHVCSARAMDWRGLVKNAGN